MKNLKVAVVGAGVVGLSCATVLQENFPHFSITILADKFSPGTTSDGAGWYSVSQKLLLKEESKYFVQF